ncbi:transcription-repair coupling factor [Brucepastera parasyntrophica]|uniref:transcription-repair coupling factor n=1 Tax=Brucepastera parasyntrophica TaxID=2880008 RepID=UPI00210E8637|nr:transcription-repair coupling factor [Brucepastera parasyntrophica]ULQ59867.1 transcription-repair coupling factor [Brucepastera parasyntrophica]
MDVSVLKKAIHNWSSMSAVLSELNEQKWPYEIEGVQGGLHGFFLSEYTDTFPGLVVIIVPTEKEIESLSQDLDLTGLDFDIFPWWGTIAYRPVPPGAVVFGQRAARLAELCMPIKSQNEKPHILVMTQRAFLTPVPPPDYFRSLLFHLSKGDDFDSAALAEKLALYGYTRVPRVTVRGEFALRGEVLDVFLPGEMYAHRIVFDFTKVEQIKLFNTADQSSVETLDEVVLYPAKEVVWDQTNIAHLSGKLASLPEFGNSPQEIAGRLTDQGTFEGEEMFFPLAFSRHYSVLDYISNYNNESVFDPAVFYFDYDRLENAQETIEREYLGLYRKARGAAGRDSLNPDQYGGKNTLPSFEVPEPQRILLDFRKLCASYTKSLLFRTIHKESGAGVSYLRLSCDPPRSFFGNITYLKEELENLISDDWRIYIFAESEHQALRIREILKDFTVTVIPLNLSSGFGIPDLKILVIQENEIFGRRRHIPKSVKHAKSSVIDTFVELNPEDYVVHVNYGIGQFKGIERVRALGNERDYIKLEYADNETVFIPIEQVNLIQRYIGNEGENPRLDRLGSKSWENRKNRVKKSVEDIAQRLIDLYSHRKASRGFAFPKDTEWQIAFEAAFPYEETEDQLTVIKEIKADMERPVPMDRLICGDVGYGKTEVAMRAAFKAVMGGKQVAFLAPTTILAEQHYETCIERFEKFPVRIAQLSRFISPGEQKKILERLSNGEIDILIGTHRIIQKDVRFKNLGLMIVDEEQRFGVKDKERLKEMRTNIDSLALSATPIPRTLHMSLLKIRDMSLLTTPPQNRHPIETIIGEFSPERIAEAIRFEVERGGQVFYLHNRVETLTETRIMLEKLVPEMLIDSAHGQMSSSHLEDIFHRFKMGGFHVLIATTIIENGIDIPNVNTIIIDRANMYGVSQLYQLRGRVGRSYRKAYAYLFYPEDRSLSEIAIKRLQVISDFTELGSGFKIAMKDMEIRGAGNLLGKEQSGDIYSVGFDLYLRLLEEAIQKLQDSDYVAEAEVWLELEYTGFIPDSYIPVAQTKMEVYKKIAAISTQDELDSVYLELLDRFGPIPEELHSLLALAEIRIICRNLSISSLNEKQGSVRVEFSKVAKVSVDRLLRMMQESAGRVKLDPLHPNVLILETGKIGLKEKSEFIREKLERLSAG